MTLNARFNLKCALRTARLAYVCCEFRVSDSTVRIGVARGGGGMDWRAWPPPCGQLTRCLSAVAELYYENRTQGTLSMYSVHIHTSIS